MDKLRSKTGQKHQTAIEFDEIEFIETPTSIVVEAIREYEESRSDLKPEVQVAAAWEWGFLANQIVGSEGGRT